MTYQASFKNGRHIAAARALAGLRQTELAKLAGLHVNTVKRLEAMASIGPRISPHAVEGIDMALRSKGIIAERWPTPSIRITDGA